MNMSIYYKRSQNVTSRNQIPFGILIKWMEWVIHVGLVSIHPLRAIKYNVKEFDVTTYDAICVM